jgi:hypothetical protein
MFCTDCYEAGDQRSECTITDIREPVRVMSGQGELFSGGDA